LLKQLPKTFTCALVMHLHLYHTLLCSEPVAIQDNYIPITWGGGTRLPRHRVAGPMSRDTNLYHAAHTGHKKQHDMLD
jgi:hypothetical protein